VDAEAERLVKRARRCGSAVNDRLSGAFFVQTVQCERADGVAEALAAKLLPDANRLELADAVLVVGPAEAVRGEAAVRRLDDAVKRLAVRPLSANLRVARRSDA
jgi:hypothetical protein